MPQRKQTSRLVAALITVVAVGGVIFMLVNGTNQAKSDGKVQVVASFYPFANFAQEVGGDKVNVSNITPAGSEPHDYEPTPQDLVKASNSAVFVYDGGTMEPWTDKFVKDYKHIAIKGSANIDILNAEGEGEHAGQTIRDPHFWLDPVHASRVVDSIKDGLIKADAKDKDYFTARADAYKAKLAQLDKDYADGLKTCKARTIVVAHEAFSYVAKRYNLDMVAIAGISPDEEPSAAKLAELSTLVKEKGIKVVFFESLTSPKLAETIASETGAKTAVLDPIEGLTDTAQKQGKDYISVQHENIAQLRSALDCQ